MTNKNKFMVLMSTGIIAVGGVFVGCNNQDSKAEMQQEVALKNAEQQSGSNVSYDLNENFLESNREMRQLLYSFNKDYATELADRLTEWDTFVATYGYSFSSNEAVAKYNELLEFEEEAIANFTAEEVAQIGELANQ